MVFGGGSGYTAQTQAKWTWLAAALPVALASATLALAQQKRRRALVATSAATSGSDAQTTQFEQRPQRHHDRTASRTNDTSSPQPRNSSSATRALDAATTNANAPPPTAGLRIGHGVWDVVLVPVVTESICFVGGLGAMYLTHIGRACVAVGLLVVLFLYRLKSAAFTTAFAPLSINTKLHLLQRLDHATLQALLQNDLPRWVKFPDVEKVEWLNTIVNTLWPYVKVAIARSVKDALTPVLTSLQSKLLLSELALHGLDLGSAAPLINGIQVQQHVEEQIVVDIDVLFATTNTDIVLSCRPPGAPVSVTIELSDFLLRGTLRVELKPLFPRWPVVGAVAISFVEAPTVTFDLETLLVNWMGLPALSTLFHSAIDQQLARRVVWPHKIVVPLVKDLSRVEFEALGANRPLGMLVVRNLALRGVTPQTALSRWTGLYSCSVALTAGFESVVTPIVYGAAVPTHAFGAATAFHVLVRDPKTQDLTLALDVTETLQPHATRLDTKSIRLDHLVPRVATHERVAFGRERIGRAAFDVVWYPFVADAERQASRLSSPSPRSARAIADLPDDVACMGAVFIRLLHCERLRPMDLNGASDPYVVFRVGSRVTQSTVKYKTLHPVWTPPQQLELLVANGRHDVLSVVVMDADYITADDPIGHVEIPLAQLQRNDRLTKTWLLDDNSGAITLELEWKGF